MVIFNCPEWGMGVQTVRLLGEATKTITQTITSCDSLEIVCLSVRTKMSQLTLEFLLSPDSHWVHLAEVTFHESGNACQPNMIITTSDSSSSAAASLPSTTAPAMTMTTTNVNITPVALAVPVTLLLLLVVVVMAAVLILWRCKHHTSHHTAKEEASHTTSHTHPPAAVSLCEETGQVHYASINHTYTSIPPQASKERAIYDDDMMYDTADLPSALYSSIAEAKTMTLQGVDLPKEASRRNKMNNPQLSETSVDQLYAQVDKKKKRDMSPRENPSPLQPSVEQQYAQEKKDTLVTKENPSPQPPYPVEQLYAQVDKKSKEKEVCAEESEAVYSVVNKPSPPQLPPKSQQLLEELPFCVNSYVASPR